MTEKKKKSLLDRTNEIGAVLSGVALLLMMIMGALDVFLGKVFNTPVPGTFEATEALMVVSAFLAIAYNQQVRGHIRVELFTSRMRPKLQLKFEVLNYFLSALFFFLLTWQGWRFGIESLRVGEYESGLIAFPVYPAKLLLALGLTLMTLQCLRDLVTAFKNIFNPETNHTT
ncbi:MAG: TRAP transporter small permease [Desulfobacterales bacterium]|nr:TRAP transporter small permease [Desulfobacterales bacterium]